MPYYLFCNPQNEEEIEEVFFKMNDNKVYIKDGITWNRVYTNPNATIDGNIDPFNEKKFVEKTGGMKGTLGGIMDAAKEASDKREKSRGKDAIKEQYYKDYSRTRGGKDHPDVKKAKLQETAKKMGVILD